MSEIHEIEAMCNDVLDVIEDVLSYGYCRWQDEKEYEDINDYAVMFEEAIEALGYQFISMRKRPFGFTFKVGKNTFLAYAKSTNVGIKWVGQI